jgi:hypothetical protein
VTGPVSQPAAQAAIAQEQTPPWPAELFKAVLLQRVPPTPAPSLRLLELEPTFPYYCLPLFVKGRCSCDTLQASVPGYDKVPMEGKALDSLPKSLTCAQFFRSVWRGQQRHRRGAKVLGTKTGRGHRDVTPGHSILHQQCPLDRWRGQGWPSSALTIKGKPPNHPTLGQSLQKPHQC